MRTIRNLISLIEYYRMSLVREDAVARLRDRAESWNDLRYYFRKLSFLMDRQYFQNGFIYEPHEDTKTGTVLLRAFIRHLLATINILETVWKKKTLWLGYLYNPLYK